LTMPKESYWWVIKTKKGAVTIKGGKENWGHVALGGERRKVNTRLILLPHPKKHERVELGREAHLILLVVHDIKGLKKQRVTKKNEKKKKTLGY